MSSTSDDTAAEAEAKRTANGAADLLDDDDVAPNAEAEADAEADAGDAAEDQDGDEAGDKDEEITSPPPPSPPTSCPHTPSDSVASVVNEAASMTEPSSPTPTSTTATEESEGKQQQHQQTFDSEVAESESQDDDNISKASSGSVAKPSIATVTAIVNEVLRQKERAKGSGSGSGSEANVDIASIASKEVDKFYEGEYEDGDEGKDEVYEEYNRHLSLAAAAKRSSRSHPWNDVRDAEKSSLFARGRDGKNKASAMISSKIRGAMNNDNNNNTQDQMEKGENNQISSPPSRMFGRKTAVQIVEEEGFEDSPDFNDLCEELGINEETHPHLRHPYRKNSSMFDFMLPTYSTGQDILRSSKCHYCLLVTGLIGIALGTSAGVTKGFEHAAKRKHKLDTQWAVEEKAKKEEEAKANAKNEGKDWWTEENADKIVEETEAVDNREKLSPEELQQLYYEVSDAFLPIWFDRSMGWEGTTYKEAMEFCRGHDDFVPCPYDVYCPGYGNKLIFNEFMEENTTWAPILDTWNQWVQVSESKTQCITYAAVSGYRPDWGWDVESGGDRDEIEKITRHIMCCLENPLGDEFDKVEVPEEQFPHVEPPQPPPNVAEEHGEGVDDPIPPPPQTDQEILAKEITGSAFDSLLSTMTDFDDYVHETLRPFWFDRSDGWKGTTYEDAKGFCESIPQGGNGHTFHLCPLKAYCPNGNKVPKPLYLQLDPFHGGMQWAPISNNHNGWVMVGKVDNQQPATCSAFLEAYHQEPEWGIDGSETGIKKHILCCQTESSPDGGVQMGDDGQQEVELVPGKYNQHEEELVPGKYNQPAHQTPIQGMPNDVGNPHDQFEPTDAVAKPNQQIPPGEQQQDGIANEEDGHHTGAGNSSPHAGEHNYDDHVMAMVKILNPLWYNRDDGWSGGSHNDALQFCFDMDQELCPLAAYCPNGPGFPALEGSFTTLDEMNSQWAPTINRPNQWVLISPFNHDSAMQCKDYEQVNNGYDPDWGYNDSDQELKHYIMCCKKSSAISQGGVQQQELEQQTNPQSSAELSSAEVFATTPISSLQSTEEEVSTPSPSTTPAPAVGFWFDERSGWNGGSHDDAMHFCAIKEVSGTRMTLCPYHEYCPSGPSEPPVTGHGLMIGDKNNEQWAPTSNGNNQWVMIGMHGHNTATQCLTHGQLKGMAPEWGLDGSNEEKKQHLMCCLPLEQAGE